MCDTKKLITTPYHPQCDGLVERLNGTLATSLTAYGKANQDNWDEFLPSFLMAYRTSTTSAHGITPFHMLYGRKVRLLMDIGLIPPSKVPTSHTKKLFSCESRGKDFFERSNLGARTFVTMMITGHRLF